MTENGGKLEGVDTDLLLKWRKAVVDELGADFALIVKSCFPKRDALHALLRVAFYMNDHAMKQMGIRLLWEQLEYEARQGSATQEEQQQKEEHPCPKNQDF